MSATAAAPAGGAVAGGTGAAVPPPLLDLRLLPPALLAWAAAWWALTRPVPDQAVAVAVACLALAVALTAFVRRRRGTAAPLTATAVATVLAAGLAHSALARTGPVAELAAQRAAVQVVAEPRGDPRRVGPSRPGGPERVVVDVLVREVTGRGRTRSARTPVLVFADAADWTRAPTGARVRLTGRLAPADPGDRAVALLTSTAPPAPVAPAGTAQRIAEDLRAGLRRACAGLPADARGLLPGLVVGDTSALPADLEEAMRAVGLTHLTAVSGKNPSR
ncbi:ComEC/Rec2 family competence protein [Kineococcus terrestris]|uniref:ComEC/Rec2 family competence protein n=1 Tax=Kineococcus terrestris TaxID=2044856 RepID=UPI0034DB28A6